LKKKQWLLFVVLNIFFIVFFYFLWHTDNPRPYTNMAYFLVMGVTALFAIKREGITYKVIGSNPWQKTFLFSGLMIIFFAITLMGHKLIERGVIPLRLDVQRWIYFTQPWKEINRMLSIMGIILVVLALEFFYRVYAIGLLGRLGSPHRAILISSVASALRGLMSGPTAGLYDFSLSYLWGTVYLKSGLAPALIVHLVWDILFVYGSPG
jgi:membrane protease YdiL (CAAX protease family)